MNITKNIGMLLLAILLILWGLAQLSILAFPAMNTITGILAIASAVFILIGR